MNKQTADGQQTGSAADGRVRKFAYGPEALHFGEFHVPDSQGSQGKQREQREQGLYPTVMLIHGGFWRTPYDYKLMSGLAHNLASRGIAAWNIEYRRVGDVGGGWPNTLLDVARAASFLRTLPGVDVQRIVTIGHSAGGQLALWLAAYPRIAATHPRASALFDLPVAPISGAISLAGVNDLELCWRLKLGGGAVAQLLKGGFDEVPDRYAVASPAALLPLGVPQVMIHGSADDIVPLKVSQAYTAAAQAAGDHAQLIELPGVDHFALIDATSAAWATTVDALKKLLALRK